MKITNTFLLIAFISFFNPIIFAEPQIPKTTNVPPKEAEESELGPLMPLEKQSDYLSEEELDRRNQLTLKAEMSIPLTFREQVEKDPAFADTWVQHYPTPMIYITFAGEAGYKRGKALVDKFATEFGGFWVDYVDVRKATISKVEIEKLQDSIEKVLRSNNIDFRAGASHDVNSLDAFIRVDVLQAVKPVEDVLRKAGIKTSHYIKIRQVPAVPESMAPAVYGGFALAPGQAASDNCITGFSVWHPVIGVRGVLTAGHCDNSYWTKGNGNSSSAINV